MSQSIDDLIKTVIEHPHCHLKARDELAGPWVPPRLMPEDVNRFCSRIMGGDLFYEDDPHVPQAGVRLCMQFDESIVESGGPFEGGMDEFAALYKRLSTLYQVAEDIDSSWFSGVCLDLHPSRFGRVYNVAYDLGNPAPFVTLAGRSFTEWLRNVVEVGEHHVEDWRESMQMAREHAATMAKLAGPVDELDGFDGFWEA